MKEYDVALSFAGEDRALARELAHHLKRLSVSVYFDEFDIASAWGHDLYSHLTEIYQNRSRFVVIFVSESYKAKTWTNVERAAAQVTATKQREPYILPIRLDQAEIEGMSPSTAYVEWSSGAERIACLVLEKIGVRVNGTDGARLIRVPAGIFTMGANDGPPDRGPEREVWLDTFYMYQHPVTIAQFRLFCEAEGRKMPPFLGREWVMKEDQPVVCVSWNEAWDYCQWAGCSLPTEAQWEKAARGTDGRRFPWGNRWEPDRCEHRRYSMRPQSGPTSVGRFPDGVSPYGIHDMCGNIWEWCHDWYDPEYYATAPAHEPRGPSSGYEKVCRGCGEEDVLEWFPVNFEASFRYRKEPGFVYRMWGFRCVLSEQGGDMAVPIPIAP